MKHDVCAVLGFAEDLRVGIEVNGMAKHDSHWKIKCNDGMSYGVVPHGSVSRTMPCRVQHIRIGGSTVTNVVALRSPNVVPFLFRPSGQGEVILQLVERVFGMFGQESPGDRDIKISVTIKQGSLETHLLRPGIVNKVSDTPFQELPGS